MKHQRNRLTALALALSMCLSLLSVTAWAEDGSGEECSDDALMIEAETEEETTVAETATEDAEGEIEIPTIETDEEDVGTVNSGTCGDDLTWTLDDAGTLTISGTGAISSYAFSDDVNIVTVIIEDGVTSIGYCAFDYCTSLVSVTIPDSVTTIDGDAFSSCTSLTNLTIGNGVTSIGSYAFYKCASLTSVTIPDSVTSIGSFAFYKCTSLSSLNIGSGVTSIGNRAFYGCESLTSVTVPDSVTSIGSYAFFDCTGLTSVTIGKGITSIGDYAFANCTSLSNITVDEENTAYSSLDGVLFNKEQTELICCPGGKSGEYVIPDSVTSIDNRAFYGCESLTSVTIPDGIFSIGSYTFYNCESLISVAIPDSITAISDYAFSYCTSLTSATIPDSVTSIGSYAFYYCTGLTSVTIGSGVTSIGKYAFYYCTSLTDVYYGGSEDDWNAISISSKNTHLINATIHYTEDTQIEISACAVALSITDYTYDGSEKTPTVTVTDANNNTLTEGTDYEVEYTNNIDAGTGTVTVIGIGSCTGTAIATFTIARTSQTVNASIVSSSISVDEATQITASTTGDGALSYESSDTAVATVDESGLVTGMAAGTAEITITAKETENYEAATANLTITVTGTVDISTCTITLSATSYTYDGTAKEPTVAVKDGSMTLINGTNYTVSYSDNVNVGTAAVTITGIGNYTGAVTATFTIEENADKQNEEEPRTHSYTSTVTKAATCTETGVRTYTCSCGDSYTETIPATGHTWNDGEVTTPATRYTEGEKTYTCTVCGATRTETIAKTSATFLFTDVTNTSASYYTPVYWAYDYGITKGTSATAFSPSATCTRAQFVTFLWRLAGKPEPEDSTSSFTDVTNTNAFYYKAVLWAVEQGVTNGTSKTTFSPSQTITRAQAVTFLYRYAGEPAVSASSSFTDVTNTSAFYYDAVQWAVANGITNGTGDGSTFSPSSPCTRGQMVTFLYRFAVEPLS